MKLKSFVANVGHVREVILEAWPQIFYMILIRPITIQTENKIELHVNCLIRISHKIISIIKTYKSSHITSREPSRFPFKKNHISHHKVNTGAH